jgi:Xaa-Pro aminopeptidase
MVREDVGAVLATGAGNFTYLTQTSLPFAPSFPDHRALAVQPLDGRPAIISPSAWADAVQAQDWTGYLFEYAAGRPYAALLATTSEAVAEMGLAQSRIGFDAAWMPVALVDGLREALPKVQWRPCDRLLRDLRVIKTREEQELLQEAVRQSDRAIVSALNHTEGTIDAVSYSLAETAERLRVHVGEFGGSATGHLGIVQGPDARHLYVPAHDQLRAGNLVRLDLTNEYRGYWSSAGRTVSIGQPTEAQVRTYRENLALKAAAVRMLRPGQSSQEVYATVAREAEEAGIAFLADAGAGHGLGTSEREAPYLAAHDATVLESGMVLALDIYTRGPDRELVHSVDVYAIEADGPRLMSWYRNWDRLYPVVGTTARHG